MTTRTASLLFLFVIGFLLSGVLLAAVQPAAFRFDASTPWLVPAIAVLCYTITLFAGRGYILPHDMADSVMHALATVAALVTLTMGVGLAGVWMARAVIDGVPGVLVLALWFGALWIGVDALHRSRRQRRLPLL